MRHKQTGGTSINNAYVWVACYSTLRTLRTHNSIGYRYTCTVQEDKLLSLQLTSAREPTSLQVTSGVVAKPSRRTLGCTFFTAVSKSCCVMAQGASCAGVKGPD